MYTQISAPTYISQCVPQARPTKAPDLQPLIQGVRGQPCEPTDVSLRRAENATEHP